MAKVTYKKTSPYYTTPQASWYTGILNHRDVPPHSSDTLMAIENRFHQRPDLLSFHLYGTVDYWWIFMVRNPNVIKDPIFDQIAGKNIFVPTLARVTSLIGS